MSASEAIGQPTVSRGPISIVRSQPRTASGPIHHGLPRSQLIATAGGQMPQGVVVRLGIVRPKAQGRAVDRLGAHQTAEMVKRVAEIVVRLGEGWSEAESLSIARLRLRLRRPGAFSDRARAWFLHLIGLTANLGLRAAGAMMIYVVGLYRIWSGADAPYSRVYL